MQFSFANSVNPLNGNLVEVFPDGIGGKFRAWSLDDATKFPNASRLLAADDVLVVCREDMRVYRVDLKEAVAAGVGGEVIEVADGEFVRADVL